MARATIVIEDGPDGTVSVALQCDTVMDLRTPSPSMWTPAQKVAAEIYVQVGQPFRNIEDIEPDGNA